jgi:hypothetical protein
LSEAQLSSGLGHAALERICADHQEPFLPFNPILLLQRIDYI